jgi:signal transduction histidine kinase/CheY-like chemotaxis protein
MMARLEQWSYWQRALLFALVAFLLTVVFEYSDVFRQLDDDISDTHARWLAPKIRFDDIVVIDVDEESIAQLQPKLGAWPYDREVYALVTQWLKKTGVRAIGYDILFSEPRKGDDELAATLDERVVLAAAALPFSFERDSAYHFQLANKSWGAAPKSGVDERKDITLPRAQLTTQAKVGVVSTPVDRDGTMRRAPLLFSVAGQLYPSFALALGQVETAAPTVVLGDGRLRVGDNAWPVSEQAEVVLRYPASVEGLRTVSFYQIVLAASGVADLAPLQASLAAVVRGKRVIIGSSSAALGDYVQTPLGRKPGVVVQAVVTELLAGGHVLGPRLLRWNLLLAIGTMLLVLLVMRPRWQLNTVMQWIAFPLVFVFVGIFAALLIAAGQAVGLLLAISAGVLTHLIGLLYQQVHLYRNNQRLEMEKRAATEADALKSQFLSHITHELRTPLTAIMGFNNINWHGSDLGREQRISNSEIVDRNCQHMLALVNNLLDQAKIDAGQLTIQTHPDKLRTVIADAITTVQPLLRGKPVQLRSDEIDVPEYLDIDAFRLRQIVLNLLSNAIKFTEKGEISVVSAWHDGELTLSVIDTGPGMPAEAVQRLFTAFGQADASIAAKHGGTGLGLTISRNLARLMRGDIKVHSAVGKGTTFTVTIAAASAQAKTAGNASPKSAESVRNVLHGTVLVAEDMPDTLALVVRHLEQLGLTVFQAVNGEQAIEIALAKRPDVVLMDMEMPIVAGAEATRTLRMCGFSAPVLALTAQKGETSRLRALAAGCNSVVEKPLTRSSLLAALSTALAPESRRSSGAARVH